MCVLVILQMKIVHIHGTYLNRCLIHYARVGVTQPGEIRLGQPIPACLPLALLAQFRDGKRETEQGREGDGENSLGCTATRPLKGQDSKYFAKQIEGQKEGQR